MCSMYSSDPPPSGWPVSRQERKAMRTATLLARAEVDAGLVGELLAQRHRQPGKLSHRQAQGGQQPRGVRQGEQGGEAVLVAVEVDRREEAHLATGRALELEEPDRDQVADAEADP